MKTIQPRQLSIFIFYFFLIEKILTSPEEILNKYSSIKTKYNHIYFNISEFELNEDIHLTIKSEYKCVDLIKYQFIDDIGDKFNFKYKQKPTFTLTKDIFGPNKYFSLFFDITKRKDLLNDLKNNVKGNFLYLEFRCNGEAEIINTKTENEYKKFSYNSLLIFSISIFLILVFIIFKEMIFSLIIFLKKAYKIKRNWQLKSNIDNIYNTDYTNRNQNQIDIHFPKEKISYFPIGKNENNMNKDYNNVFFFNCNKNCNYIKNNNCFSNPINYQDVPPVINQNVINSMDIKLKN